MADLSNVTSGAAIEADDRRVHDDNYVLNELKNLLFRSKVAGRHATADRIDIFFHLDELFEAGAEGVQLSVADTTQDFVIQNPAASGNTVDVVKVLQTASVGFNTERWLNVDFPAGGTSVEPFNMSDHSLTATFNVKHGDSLADTGTADRQLPGGFAAGSKNVPISIAEEPSLRLAPGETLLSRTELVSTGEDFGMQLLIAEYEQGRQINP